MNKYINCRHSGCSAQAKASRIEAKLNGPTEVWYCYKHFDNLNAQDNYVSKKFKEKLEEIQAHPELLKHWKHYAPVGRPDAVTEDKYELF